MYIFRVFYDRFLPQKRLYIYAFVAFASNVTILFYNLKTLNFWDDEVNGYYLSILDENKIVSLYSNNVHEDPLLYNYILHHWMEVFGQSATSARVLSLCFWILAVLFIYIFVVSLLGSKKFGYVSVIVASVLPYHWLFPIAARWYSLSALLVTINFVFYAEYFQESFSLDKLSKNEQWISGCNRQMYLIGYILSGALLWYTTYAAPVYFFGAFVVLLTSKFTLKKLRDLLIGYVGILILYVPWFGTFYNQVLESTGGKGAIRWVVDIVLSHYVLIAGEMSTPEDIHIWLPAIFIYGIIIYLTYQNAEKVREEFTYFMIPILGLIVTGVIWTKYMLLVSPLMCIYLSVLAYISIENDYEHTVLTLVLLLSVLCVGSFVNMISRSGWLASRWLDKYDKVVKKYSKKYPQSIFASNSQTALYYRGCIHNPLVNGNDKYMDGSIVQCKSTSIDKLLTSKDIKKSHNNKYVLILGGYSSKSQNDLKTTLEMLRNKGFEILSTNRVGRDSMLRYKRMVSNKDIPSHRIYVYVLEA